MAKKFFYVCAGLFLLALSYHLGAHSASAQGPTSAIAAVSANAFSGCRVYAQNGDVYDINSNVPLDSRYVGNVFNAPTAAAQQSWGQVKSTYRK